MNFILKTNTACRSTLAKNCGTAYISRWLFILCWLLLVSKLFSWFFYCFNSISGISILIRLEYSAQLNSRSQVWSDQEDLKRIIVTSINSRQFNLRSSHLKMWKRINARAVYYQSTTIDTIKSFVKKNCFDSEDDRYKLFYPGLSPVRHLYFHLKECGPKIQTSHQATCLFFCLEVSSFNNNAWMVLHVRTIVAYTD